MKSQKEIRPAGHGPDSTESLMWCHRSGCTEQENGTLTPNSNTPPSIPDLLSRSQGLAVFVEDPSGRYRRRIYLTTNAAEKAVKRAKARGVRCRVVLVQFHPIGGVDA